MLVAFTSLWLPILLSAVLVFIASSIIWMASPLHKHDYKNPGDKEKPILDFVRSMSFSPGVYYVPWCGHGADRKDPANIEKMKAGPFALLTVMPGAPNMGKCLGLWMLNLIVISTFIAYVTGVGHAAGTPYLKIFQVAGAVSFIAHAGNAATMSIWMGMPWSQFPGRFVDALIYALLTAGVFGWLWPHAV